jgi:hypothetical protein
MLTVKLHVVPPAGIHARTVLEIPPSETCFFIADGNTNLVCGKCGTKLADGIYPGHLKKKVLKCNKCLSYNEVD